jgi:hypothetical protein
MSFWQQANNLKIKLKLRIHDARRTVCRIQSERFEIKFLNYSPVSCV